MAEQKKVEKIKYNIGKEKGQYTGDAESSILSTSPEGYGDAVFTSGIILNGRFKNGNFISGTARQNGNIYTGEFDNLKWLGGGDGKIEYHNGDYLRGSINPVSKKLEITEFSYTQDFDDKITGAHQRNAGDKIELVATETFANGSTISGVFEPSSSSKLYSAATTPDAFGIKKDYLVCTNGSANIILREDDRISAKINGNYAGEKNSNRATIIGTYTFANKVAQTTITTSGEFSYQRNAHHEQTKSRFSEDFSRDMNALNFHESFDTILTLQNGGTVEIRSPAGVFWGTKNIDENGKVTYLGKMRNSDGDYAAEGTFDPALALLSGKVLIKNGAETFSATFHSPQIMSYEREKLMFSGEATGSLAKINKTLTGNFTANFVTRLDRNGLVQSAKLAAEPIHHFGTIKHRLDSGATFEGELYSPEQKAKIDPQYEHLHLDMVSTLYFGHYSLSNQKSELIFDKTGYFGAGYQQFCGTLYAQNALETGWNFNGDFDKIKGYHGKLISPKNADYQEGDFDTKLKFLSGKFRQTYPNLAIFEGETADLETGSGVFEREKYFRHEGDFEFDSELYPTLKKGTVLVHFDDFAHTFCRGEYDDSGFPLFDGKKYLCNFKNDLRPDGVPAVGDTITDAYTQFIEFTTSKTATEYCYCEADLAEIAESTRKQIFERYGLTKTPEILPEIIYLDSQEPSTNETAASDNNSQISKKANEGPAEQNNTISAESENAEQPQNSSKKYRAAVELAGELIDTDNTRTQDYDIANAQVLMAKVTNPNKPQEQNKDN